MVASTAELRRSLKLSVVDGLLHAVMVGASESYLGALAVELGHSDHNLALLATVPMLAGAFAQLFAERLTAWCGSRRRFVVVGATLQALANITFAIIALTEARGLAPLLLAKVMFWLSGNMIAPAWGAWMARLTEPIKKERYFAWRSSATHAVLLVSFTGAGAFLAAAETFTLEAFALLHVVALVARLGSAWALSQKIDPGEPEHSGASTTMLRALKGALVTSRWRVAVYMAALMMCVHISAPFFTPYMLKDLGLGYFAFASLTSMSILAKVVTFPLWQRLSARLGLRAVLVVGGLGIAAVPLLWSVVSSLSWLLAVQSLSGLSWGAVEFASFQLLLASAKAEHRLAFLSLASCVQSAAQVCGALCGSFLLAELSLAYTDAFLLSGFGRALPLVLLLSDQSARLVRGAVASLILRIESVGPAGGVLRRFLVGKR